MPELGGELDFSTLAIAHKILTREQVEQAEAILEQEALKGKDPRQIEDVLLERGLIKAEEVWAVYKARERLMRDAKTIGRRIGGYEILGKVGEGGLGVVYKARQLSMGRTVALKVLHEKWVGDDEFRKRFLVEARLVGRLSHQNLIQVFDVGRYKDTLFYSMEFIDGETVEDVLDRDGAMDVKVALHIMFQVARALQYLGNKKIVHRDVKPGNIMMTKDSIAKLGDFGFVKSSLESVLSSEGEVLGTPDYISPEAAMGEKELDFRSDLYSLGASFYHMLTGNPPFGGSGSDVMEAHIKDQIPAIESIMPNLPARAIEIVNTLMEKNPSDRYQSFKDLFEDLELLRLEVDPEKVEEKPNSSVMRVLARGGGKVDQLLNREKDLTKLVRILVYAIIAESALLAVAIGILLHLLLK
ncbi:MAG: serine/threonine protein kinase [Planctomycetes bacterium]|nr:serine/threonine protein kinase [Planctomycetota bacterium]